MGTLSLDDLLVELGSWYLFFFQSETMINCLRIARVLTWSQYSLKNKLV